MNMKSNVTSANIRIFPCLEWMWTKVSTSIFGSGFQPGSKQVLAVMYSSLKSMFCFQVTRSRSLSSRPAGVAVFHTPGRMESRSAIDVHNENSRPATRMRYKSAGEVIPKPSRQSKHNPTLSAVVAQWLECRATDLEIVGSNPSMSWVISSYPPYFPSKCNSP